MKTTPIAIALALAVSTLNGHAQDAGGSPPPAGGHHERGFHLLPPHAEQQLNLSADQKKQLADLEAQVKAQIEQILTPAQLEQLKQMRPPPPHSGPGCPGGSGGPGQGEPPPPQSSGTNSTP